MKSARICPKCGRLVYFNSYFGAYICEYCDWEDASYAKKRDSAIIATEVRVSSKYFRAGSQELDVLKKCLARKNKSTA